MNYSPDYHMRRRNQECGCNRNISRQGGRSAFWPGSCNHPQQENRSGNGSGCCNTPRQEDRSGDGSSCCNSPRQENRSGNGSGCCNVPRRESREEGCGNMASPKSETPRSCLDTYPVGMTYVPWQVWQELYNLEEGFCAGTIFRELDYPWEVGRCAKCR